MTVRHLAFLSLALAACAGNGRHGTATSGDGGMVNTEPCGPNVDCDGDGYTPAQGDCDDSNPLVGPNSTEIGGNGIDDDCDGKIDNVAVCDTGTAGMTTSLAITQALGICDMKFVKSTSFNGPSDPMARNIFKNFGVITPLEGTTMAYISSGLATNDPSYDPQPGTDLSGGAGTNMYPNPVVTLKLPAGKACGAGVDQPAATVYDYTEYEIDLKIPYNANSLSFQTQFFSAEYPEFVCQGFNDRFLVILDDGSGNPQNIEFDMMMNTISVDNSFFTVCENSTDHPPQTQRCTQPISKIMGTGFDQDDGTGIPVGGSTGWLTTSAPVVPGNDIKLRFIIFDESDSIYDSSALIDNFLWVAGKSTGPVTIQ